MNNLHSAFLACALLGLYAEAATNSPQQQALLSLKQALLGTVEGAGRGGERNGGGSSESSSLGLQLITQLWVSGSEPCAARPWPGVKCDDDGNVAIIELRNVGFKGTLPEAASSFSSSGDFPAFPFLQIL
jgi:hypothetical protein